MQLPDHLCICTCRSLSWGHHILSRVTSTAGHKCYSSASFL